METSGLTSVELGEKPTKEQIFEHLFPGNKFKDLPPLNPINGPGLIKFFMWDVGSLIDEVSDADRNREGYANRHDYSFPDQLSMVATLPDITPSDISSSGIRGWFSDLLQEGEKLGGVGVKPISFIPRDRWYITTAMQRNPLDWINNLENPDMYDTVTARVVGVLSAEGKPKAIITFVPGPRPEKRKESKVTSKSLAEQPTTV